MALRLDDVDLVRDRALVERFQEGDTAAFDTLYRRYFARLVRFCQKRVGDPLEAEEIAQEAFAKALRALPAFEGERRFYPWMTVIASHLCVDWHRRRDRTEPSSQVDLGVIDGGQEKIVDAVDVQILATALGRIAPRHREVLDLREQQGWSYQEIADHYGATLGTVEALLFRARKALQREFMAVVGGDRDWVAVPLVGGALGRLASLRAKIDAWAHGVLPAMSGPAVAAALAVTAVTGAVGGAALLDGTDGPVPTTAVVPSAQAAPAAVTTTSLPELLHSITDGAVATSAPAQASARAERPQAAPAPRAAPIIVAESRGVDAVAGSEGEAIAKDKPLQADAGEVMLGLDPARAVDDIATTIIGYPEDRP